MKGLDDCGHNEGETVKNGVLVHPIQKFGRTFILRRQGSKEYRHVEVDAGLGKVVSEIDLVEPDCEARRLTPIPAISGFELIH